MLRFIKDDYPSIEITQEMLNAASKLILDTKVNRTVASDIDTLTGNLGEFVFAQYYYGDWKMNRVGKNKGDVDFVDIEIKTSSFPFNSTLNLLVREDYAWKRKPLFYIQIIIDVKDRKASKIDSGTKAYLCGFASFEDIDNAPLKDFGSKFGGKGGYKCYYINIIDLNPMKDFKNSYERRSKNV